MIQIMQLNRKKQCLKKTNHTPNIGAKINLLNADGHLRALVVITMLMACVQITRAYDFEVDGVFYLLNSSSSTEVSVTYKSSSYDSYSGTVDIPETVTYGGVTYDVTSIGKYAFRDCTSLTSVTIPSSVTSIGSYAFEDCTSLASVTIPSSVTSIGDYAFSGCTSLASVTNSSGVTSIGDYAFSGCTILASVTISEGVNSIGDYAFYKCTSLTSVTIPSSVTSIGDYAFYFCTSLTSVTISEGVTSIGHAAFWVCTSLASVTIPSSVTSIGSYAFKSCTSLTSVTIPSSVTSIGYHAFMSCTSLASVTIPSSVTSIGQYAFGDCTSLVSVYIVSRPILDFRVFYKSNNITDVYCLSETPPSASSSSYNSDMFSSSVYENATLHVPLGCSSTYQSHSLWKQFYTVAGDATTCISAVAMDKSVCISSGDGKVEVSGVEGVVSVYGMDGSIVAHKMVDGNTEITLPSGLYIVKVSDGKDTTTKKIMVK